MFFCVQRHSLLQHGDFPYYNPLQTQRAGCKTGSHTQKHHFTVHFHLHIGVKTQTHTHIHVCKHATHRWLFQTQVGNFFLNVVSVQVKWSLWMMDKRHAYSWIANYKMENIKGVSRTCLNSASRSSGMSSEVGNKSFEKKWGVVLLRRRYFVVELS